MQSLQDWFLFFFPSEILFKIRAKPNHYKAQTTRGNPTPHKQRPKSPTKNGNPSSKNGGATNAQPLRTTPETATIETPVPSPMI